MTQLDQLWKKGQEFLGVKYPLISGAMSWVSTPVLVEAVGNAGGFGVLAGGNTPPEALEKDLATCEKSKTPFAVNLITIAPRYKEHIELAAKSSVPFVVFAGTIPAKEEIARMKDLGKKVMAFAATEALANRMLKFGADALIIEGRESGGHIGPVSTLVLLQDVLYKFRDKTHVFVAGGVGRGEMVAHLLLMGATGVQMGTRFVMTEECQVHAKMKEAFVRAGAKDAVANTQVDPTLPVVSVRALRNKAGEEFAKLQIDLIAKIGRGEITRTEGILLVENFWLGGLRRAVQDGDVENGSVMAGQSVGLMDAIKPMAQVFADLVAEAESELARIKSQLTINN
ncbi:2-nitropropane dioxygenase [Planctomycetales bacterium]|nr:2-nitropropane dioxygenase [Planctomycetales bacterium]GHS98069.1 2-nitropropane dioxygenase [Planctomycetales bacterium]